MIVNRVSNRAVTIAKIFGASISVRWSVLLLLPIAYVVFSERPLVGLVSVVSVTGMVLVHELGHALVVLTLGHKVLAIEFGILHGHCRYAEPSNEWHDALIAWGGPLFQLVVGVSIIALLTPKGAATPAVLAPVVLFLGYLSVFEGIAGLIPWPGAGEEYDAGRAWRIVPLLIARFSAKTGS